MPAYEEPPVLPGGSFFAAWQWTKKYEPKCGDADFSVAVLRSYNSLMVDLKRLELSTSRMRTERSPEWFRYMHPKFLKKCRENKNIEKT